MALLTRRRLLQTGMAGIIGTGIAPLMFTRGAWAQEFCNNPTGDTVTFGFNMPLTGAYADEGADQQRAFDAGRRAPQWRRRWRPDPHPSRPRP